MSRSFLLPARSFVHECWLKIGMCWHISQDRYLLIEPKNIAADDFEVKIYLNMIFEHELESICSTSEDNEVILALCPISMTLLLMLHPFLV